MLGAAFNPPHLGHLVLAQEAVARLGLAELLLVPTGEAPHKRIEDDPGADVRLEMATLAAEGNERLEVTDIEVERDGPSYSYRTLELLSEQRPEARLHFVIGADVAVGLESWRKPERVVELSTLAVAARPGTDRREVDETLERLGAADTAVQLEMPEIALSSSLVRRRVGAGEPIRYLVPEGVRELIVAQGLYAG